MAKQFTRPQLSMLTLFENPIEPQPPHRERRLFDGLYGRFVLVFSSPTFCERTFPRHSERDMDSTSVSLLKRLREPNAGSAWQRFVDLYAPLIYHWGLHQGLSSADAADLVQEVLALLVVKLPTFEYDPSRRFRGWLRTMTVNKARDLHRRNAVNPLVGQAQTLSLQEKAIASLDLFEEAEYQSFLVNRALELMRSEFREETWRACWLLVVEGKKARDVAKELGLSLNSVYLAKSRVLGRLREELAGLIE